MRTQERHDFEQGQQCQPSSGLVEELGGEEEDEDGAVEQADRSEDHVADGRGEGGLDVIRYCTSKMYGKAKRNDHKVTERLEREIG